MLEPWIVISARHQDGMIEAVELARLLTPLDRIVVVATTHTATAAHARLAWHSAVELVIQPWDLDTGPEMLLALTRILERDPLGSVVFLPAECQIIRPRTVAGCVRDALMASSPEQITLLGTFPLDWGSDRSRNALVATGRVLAFWKHMQLLLPEEAALFEHYMRAIGGLTEESALHLIYAQMNAKSFALDLLADARPLALLPLPPGAIRTVSEPARTLDLGHTATGGIVGPDR